MPPYNFDAQTQNRLQGHKNIADIFPWAQSQAVQNVNIHGLTCDIYRAPGETTPHYSLKWRLLNKAILKLQQAGIMFQNGDVHEFKVGMYNTGPSRGVVYWDQNAQATHPTVVLMLGDRITEHVTHQLDPNPHDATDKPVAGGKCLSPPRGLFDRFYDYYRGKQPSKKRRCGLNQVFHEFGHIFHQLEHPQDYFRCADLAKTPYKALDANQKILQDFVYRHGSDFVSQYAAKNPAEYVAEVFGGIMMGIDWNVIDPQQDVTTLYTHLGGPTPPQPPPLISRMNDFINQQCTCPGHGQGLNGPNAKIIW